MYRALQRINVRQAKPSQITPVHNEQVYKPSYIVTSINSPDSSMLFASPSKISYQELVKQPSINRSKQSQGTSFMSEVEKYIIPLVTVLSILGVIALTALGIGIYAITVSSEKTTTESITTASTTTITTTTPIMLTWNISGNTIAGTTGTSGATSTLLNSPIGLALDSSNAIHICDSANNRVQKQSSNAWISTTEAGETNGVSGSTSTYLSGPAGVVTDTSGDIYIADKSNHRIQFWYSGGSSGSTVAGVTGSPGSSTSQLNTPGGITRDSSSGIIYVADTMNHRVISFSPGSSVGSIVAGNNGQGSGSNQLNNPNGLYFDSSTNSLIIANTGAHNIVRWTLGSSTWSLVAGSTTGVSGTSATLLNSPNGVTLDSMSNVYVADTNNHRIQFFSSGQSSGTSIFGTTGTSGSTSLLLNQPSAVVVDTQLNVYVADKNNHRVQKFIKL